MSQDNEKVEAASPSQSQQQSVGKGESRVTVKKPATGKTAASTLSVPPVEATKVSSETVRSPLPYYPDETKVIEFHVVGIGLTCVKKFYVVNPTNVDICYSWERVRPPTAPEEPPEEIPPTNDSPVIPVNKKPAETSQKNNSSSKKKPADKAPPSDASAKKKQDKEEAPPTEEPTDQLAENACCDSGDCWTPMNFMCLTPSGVMESGKKTQVS